MNSFEVKIYKHQTGKYQTKYYDPKTGQRKRKVHSSLKEAKGYKSELEIRFSRKGSQIFSNLRVSQAMKNYLEKFPHSRVKDSKISFTSFIETFGKQKVTEITPSDLKEWFEERKKERDYSERTLNRMKSQLWGFFIYLEEEDMILQNPLRKVRFKRHVAPKRARVVLSESEIESILEDAKKFNPKILYPYLYTMAHTGARRGEILKLKRSDIDFETGLILFRETKNGRDRSLQMNSNLESFIKNHLNNHDGNYLIITSYNDRCSDTQINRLLNKLKVHFPHEKDWTFHSLRHSYAYNFLKNGGKMYQLQAILGHTQIGTTVDLYGQIEAQVIDTPSPYKF